MTDLEIQELASHILDAIDHQLEPEVEIELSGYEVPRFKILYLYSIMKRNGWHLTPVYNEEKKPSSLILKKISSSKENK